MSQTTAFRKTIERIPGFELVNSVYVPIKHSIRKLFFQIRGRNRFSPKIHNPVLSQAIGKNITPSDISDHLETIFFFATGASPKLIVELGTRGGESTRALLAAASVYNAPMLSIDIDDCGSIRVPHQELWHFVQADDIEFGKSRFESWCAQRALAPQIDVLFIDTSHEYAHTKQEIEVWSKYLSPNGVMMFHDTNMDKGIFFRFNGSVGISWNNDRGVIRAIEEWLGKKYDEHTFFSDITDDYCILHFPNCSGLTVFKNRATK